MYCRTVFLSVTAILAITLAGCDSSSKSKTTVTTKTTMSVEDSLEGSVTARVKAIDHETRVMTLQDERGDELTLVVDDKVKRLNEVQAGDNVLAKYKATLLAELRPPTEEEKANPFTVVNVEGRSPEGTTPVGGTARAMTVVTTVEAVNVPSMLVTLRGPMGESTVVRGRNPDNVKKLRVGDTIVITYSKSIVIALDKVAPR